MSFAVGTVNQIDIAAIANDGATGECLFKGCPIRVELGPKDIEKSACVLARRDMPDKGAKMFGVPLTEAPTKIVALLKEMQNALYEKAKKYRDENLFEVDSYDDFKSRIDGGGFFLAHWDGTRATEDKIAAETKATIRCIPFDRKKEAGKCMVTGQPSEGRVVLAKAY